MRRTFVLVLGLFTLCLLGCSNSRPPAGSASSVDLTNLSVGCGATKCIK